MALFILFTLIMEGQYMLNKCFTWLFNEEERRPIAFITIFFMIVIMSTAVCLFILSVSRHVMWM